MPSLGVKGTNNFRMQATAGAPGPDEERQLLVVVTAYPVWE